MNPRPYIEVSKVKYWRLVLQGIYTPQIFTEDVLSWSSHYCVIQSLEKGAVQQ